MKLKCIAHGCDNERPGSTLLCKPCESLVPGKLVEDMLDANEAYRQRRLAVIGWLKMRKSQPMTAEEVTAVEVIV